MALNFRRFYNGIQIKVVASATADTLGELEVFGTKLQYFNGTSVSPIVTEAHASQGANRLKSKDLEATTTKIVDTSDTTKKAGFDTSGATTGTTTTLTFAQTAARAITFPDATDTLVGKATTDVLTNKTLVDTSTAIGDVGDNTKQIKFNAGGTTGTSTTITAAQTANRIITLPDTTDTLIGAGQAVNIQNKSFEDSSTTIYNSGDGTKLAKFDASGISTLTTRTYAFPDANTTFVGTDVTQTLTNKTLTDSSTAIADSGDATKQIKFDAAGTTGTSTTLLSSQTTNKILTLPDATDTIVGKATTDVLTNKTLSGNTATNLVSGSGTFTFNTTGTITAPNATDTLVGKATTDALTNKDYQGGTATNTSRMTVPGATKSTLDALTRKAATIVYGTDTTKLYVDNGTSLTPVGSAATYNLLTFDTTWNAINTDNSDFENSVGSWVTYNDSAQVPVDLTGGSATNLTLSRTTTAGEVLDGTASLKVVKTANNSQGQGLSCVFNVPPAYQGKLIQISIPYKVSTGSLASGDLYAYVYNVTNSVLIGPINNAFDNATQGTLTAVFATQTPAATPANIQMRIGIHFASTSAVAQTIEFDDIIIAPTYQATAGASVSDWNNSLTFTTTNFGTITNSNFWSRRVGDTLEVQGSFTCGTTVGSAATINLPTGYTIDSTKFTSTSNIQQVGYAYDLAGTNAIASQGVPAALFYDGSTTSGLFFSVTTSTNTYGKMNGNNFTTSSVISFKFSIPITGWVATGTPIGMIATDEASATLTTAGFGTISLQSTWVARIGDRARFRGYFKSGTNSGTMSIGLPSGYIIDPNKFATTTNAQHVGYWYRIKTGGDANFGTSDNFGNLFYDGSDTSNIYFTRSSGSNIYDKSATLLADGDGTSYEFTLPIKGWVTNGQVVVPTVAANYYGSSTALTNNTTTAVTFATKNFDTHNAYSGGLYTIPISGKYHVNARIQNGGTLTNNTSYSGITIRQNSTDKSNTFGFGNTSLGATQAVLTDTLDCIAGDTISIRVSPANITSPTLPGNTDISCGFSIVKVG